MTAQTVPQAVTGAQAASEEAQADAVRRAYPGWCVWRGKFTHMWYALPPRHLRHLALVWAPDVKGVKMQLDQIHTWLGWHGPYPSPP